VSLTYSASGGVTAKSWATLARPKSLISRTLHCEDRHPDSGSEPDCHNRSQDLFWTVVSHELTTTVVPQLISCGPIEAVPAACHAGLCEESFRS